MKLAEQGKIDLDETIETYLNDTKLKYYVSDSNKINCRNLLTHTSGLPLHFGCYYDGDTISMPVFTQLINKHDIVVNQPSAKYAYANLGYGILGELISKTSEIN